MKITTTVALTYHELESMIEAIENEIDELADQELDEPSEALNTLENKLDALKNQRPNFGRTRNNVPLDSLPYEAAAAYLHTFDIFTDRESSDDPADWTAAHREFRQKAAALFLAL